MLNNNYQGQDRSNWQHARAIKARAFSQKLRRQYDVRLGLVWFFVCNALVAVDTRFTVLDRAGVATTSTLVLFF